MAAPEHYIPWRERPALRAGEIAEILGVSRSTADRAIKTHGLKVNRRLGVPLYPQSEVRRLLEALDLGEEFEAVTEPASHGELAEVRQFMEKR